MSGKNASSLHSMIAMEGARIRRSVVNHCDIHDGYCRWAQATQEPSIAMGKRLARVLYWAVAYSIEFEEGKRRNGLGGTPCLASSRNNTAVQSNCGDMYIHIHCRIRSRVSNVTKDVCLASLGIGCLYDVRNQPIGIASSRCLVGSSHPFP